MDIKSKIIQPHRKGCAALRETIKGVWPHPWSVPSGRTHYLDLLGRKNGTGRRWIEYRCNDAGCPALMAVMEDSFLSDAVWGGESRK